MCLATLDKVLPPFPLGLYRNTKRKKGNYCCGLYMNSNARCCRITLSPERSPQFVLALMELVQARIGGGLRTARGRGVPRRAGILFRRHAFLQATRRWVLSGYVAKSMVRRGGGRGKQVESGEFVTLTCTKVQVGWER